jgi:predicted SAM-dependent methyltransferase
MVLNLLRRIKRSITTSLRRQELKSKAKKSNLRIVVGASRVFEAGWEPTEIDYLNLLKDSDWAYYFKPDSVEAILAEHVWEHLSYDDGLQAAKNCYKYLKPGGHLRIAVPDGNHSDPAYIAMVKPGGTGAGADDHKLLYTQKIMTGLLVSAGFKVKCLEWFDETGKFHFEEWDKKDGMVWRSKRFDERNKSGELKYTSLIVDGVK